MKSYLRLGSGLGLAMMMIFIIGSLKSAVAQNAMLPEQLTNMFQIGRTFTGVKIPSYSNKDVLQMVLEADTITRVDSTYLDITNLVIKFYQKGKVASTVKMEEAKYHLLDAVLTSKPTEKRPQIDHESFVMTGNQMIVDTKNEVNSMRGQVRTVILNADKFSGSLSNFGK